MPGLNESSLQKSYHDRSFLIVDDIENVRRSIKKMVYAFGAKKVDIASDGKEAVSFCTNVAYDVILCDYNLGPGKNGQQILEELRHKKLLKHTGIFLLITAESSKDMVLAAIENQPDGYLSKPYTQAAIKKRLDTFIEQKEALLDINHALDQEDHITAIKLCGQKIAEKSKYRTWCLKTMANLHYLKGNFGKAKQLYTDAQAERELTWACIGLAKIALAENDYDAAEAACQKMFVNNSQNIAAHELLVEIYEKKGDLIKAQQSLEVAVAISPLNLLRQKKLGEVCVENQDIERATDAYRRTVHLGENSCHESAEAHLDFSRCLTDLCDGDMSSHGTALFNEAMSELQHITKKYGESDEIKIQSLLVETRALSGQNYKEKALKVLEKAQTLCESNPESLSVDCSLELAKSLCSVDKSEEAQKILSQVEGQDKKRIQAAMTAIQEGSFNYREINRARSLNKKGIQLIENDNLIEAIDTFKSALSENPNNPGLNLNLVQTLLKLFNQNPPGLEDIEFCQICIERIKNISEDHPQYKRFIHLAKKVDKLTSAPPDNINIDG